MSLPCLYGLGLLLGLLLVGRRDGACRQRRGYVHAGLLRRAITRHVHPQSRRQFLGASRRELGWQAVDGRWGPRRQPAARPRPQPGIAADIAATQTATTQGLRWSLFQGSQDVRWDTQATSGVVGLTVLQPKFLEQFPNARFHFKKGRPGQRGTFKGVWLNKEHTEWALEKEQQ